MCMAPVSGFLVSKDVRQRVFGSILFFPVCAVGFLSSCDEASGLPPALHLVPKSNTLAVVQSEGTPHLLPQHDKIHLFPRVAHLG